MPVYVTFLYDAWTWNISVTVYYIHNHHFNPSEALMYSATTADYFAYTADY